MLRTASSSVGPTGAHSSIKAECSSSNSRRSSPGRIAVLANAPCFTACMLRKRILPRSNIGRSALHAHRNQVAKAKGELYKLGKDRLTEISFLSNVSRDQLPVAVVGLDHVRGLPASRMTRWQAPPRCALRQG